MQLDFDEVRGQYEVVESGRRRAAEPNLVVTAKDALAPFLDKWVPVPFLQVRPNNQFREGPADWARVRVVDLEARYGAGYRDEQGNRYRAVLAFDTGLIAEAEGRAYLAPSPKDVTSGALFALAPQQRANHWLLRQGWMSQWLEELFRELHPRATLEEIEGDIKQKPQEATARYLAFLGLLADAAHFPPIKLVGDAERPGRGAIEVDLVLDVGNSRTCGLLIEAAGELGVNLNDSYELALRDLSHPESVHTKPFESRVEFAQAWFGKNHLSRLGGRADAFVWPTMTRVGPEATRLAARRRGTEGNTGMSSPKRYLWDEEPQTREWRFNVAYAQDQTAMPAAAGPMAQLVNQKGEPLHLVDPDADSADHLPVFEPLYSRSSIMTFVLSEVLLQALTLMNSPQQRGRRAHAETPRRLRRIVLTLPTGMPLAERLIFRKRAEAARDLVWMMMGWKLDDPAAPAPRVLTDWDEASCTQLVYLYTEVARNFGGDARRFFQIAAQAARPAGRRHAQHRQHRCRRRHHRPHHQLLPPRRRRHLGDAVPRAEVPRGLQRGGRRHPAARRAGPRAAADRGGDARRRHRQSRRPDGRAGGRRPRRRGRDPAQPAPAVRAADRPSARAGVHARRRDLRSDLGRRRGRAATLRLVLPRGRQAVRGGRDLRQRGGAQARRQGLRPQGHDLPGRPAQPRQDGARRDGAACWRRSPRSCTPTIATCCCCRAGRRACPASARW